MIHIQKGKEPESLVAYRKEQNATYDGFGHKDHIREALLRDQGSICAYCMRRIFNDYDKTKIEHWKPQSKLKTEYEKLDYRIMLGVCDGCKGSAYKYTTCDEHRKNADLIVNPFDHSMMETIYYTRDGHIHSHNPEIDKDLNVKLNLNCEITTSRIVSNRKHVFDEVKARLIRLQQKGLWTKKTLNAVASSYEKREGVYPEYVGVAQYVINTCLKKWH